MLVPKIFRLLFFRQTKGLKNVFDAVRNSDTVYINADEALSDESSYNSQNDKNTIKHNTLLTELKKGEDYKKVLVIYGHNKWARTKVYNMLNDLGYSSLYDVGSEKDLNYVKQSTS